MALLRTDRIVAGGSYTFYYAWSPSSAIFYTDEGAADALNMALGTYADFTAVKGVFGRMDVHFTVNAGVGDGTVDSWDTSIKTALEQFLGTDIAFVKADGARGIFDTTPVDWADVPQATKTAVTYIIIVLALWLGIKIVGAMK